MHERSEAEADANQAAPTCSVKIDQPKITPSEKEDEGFVATAPYTCMCNQSGYSQGIGVSESEAEMAALGIVRELVEGRCSALKIRKRLESLANDSSVLNV